MGKERPTSSDGFEEHIFENVTDHTQLDPFIVQGIVRCVPSSGMRTTDEDTLNHIQGDMVHVYRDSETKEVFAFSSTVFGSPNDLFKSDKISDTDGCYLAGATISKDRQSTGFYKKMNKRRIGVAVERGLDLVFTRTQNPRVQSGIQSVLNGMQEDGKIKGYEVQRILIPEHYGHMLTEEKPVDNKVSFGELDYDKGDAYVLLFLLQYHQK